jgi:hypothetical protein
MADGGKEFTVLDALMGRGVDGLERVIFIEKYIAVVPVAVSPFLYGLFPGMSSLYFTVMKNGTLITLSLAVILPVIAAFPCLSSASQVPGDSALQARESDSLMALQERVQQRYLHGVDRHGPFSLPAYALFIADAPVPSEALSQSPLCLPVRYGLSNRFNRFLLYGHVAPVSSIVSGGSHLCSSADPQSGTDDVFTTEIDSIVIAPDNVCRYVPSPGATVTPEASIFWETGLFDGNILAVRFARPLSRFLTVNAFSNYRSSAGKPFSHDGNGIFEFYRSLFSDTSAVVNRGYNPGIIDYTSGLQTVWSGRGGNTFRCGVKYGDEDGQYYIDKPGWNNLPVLGRINRFHTMGTVASDGNRIGPVILDLEGLADNNSMIRRTPDSIGMTRRSDGQSREMAGAIRAQIPVGTHAVSALVYRISRLERRPFIEQETNTLRQSATFGTTIPMVSGSFKSSIDAAAGALAFSARDSSAIAPLASAAWVLSLGDYSARAYATYSAIPWNIPYDTALFSMAPFLDRYSLVGGEVEAGGASAGVVLGCQSVLGMERGTVLMAWPDTMLPHEQAGISVLVAPRLGPWRGITVSSRTFISNARPFVRTRGLLQFTAHPAGTEEHIDIDLWCDYWSGRDPVSFAGESDWNRPVLDVGTEVAVHVSAFRFFGKIDNLLNRKFAYIPGYYSPGLTFRWGIGWYLQK